MWRQFLSAFLLPIFIAAFSPLPLQAAYGKHESPKLINFFLGYEIKPDDPAKLAQWDIVVLDMDQSFQFPERLREIKRINPRTKLLAYVDSSDISEARFRGHPASPGAKLASRIPDAWFLARPDGSRIQWWPGSWMVNASADCPTVDGVQWNDFLGGFIRDEIVSTGLWDGVFLDAAYADVTPFSGPNIDINRNGTVDSIAKVNQSWRRGMTELIQKVRAANPDILIMNNSSADYAPLTNGTLFENFPDYGFAETFTLLRTALSKNVSPKISAVNTNTDNQERPDDYRLMRYGLAATLIADGYYSFDAGDAGHHRTWWYDEYDAPIGPPRGEPRIAGGPTSGSEPSVWAREFSRGYVIVNATKNTEVITLPGAFEKIQGTQDTKTNNGAILTKVTVPAEDGLILLRRSDATEVRDVAFQNGSFFQVLDMNGRRRRNAFFANRDDVPGGAKVLVTDLDRDDRDDVVFSQYGLVTVRLGAGTSNGFRPFGSAYRGDIELAAGQTDESASWELILTPAKDREATVLVTNASGRTIRSWLAYRPEFVGGATVGLGDFNRDGTHEIVTAPGDGGGPHIRTFTTDGTSWRGGFFAFPASENGGAHVAVGDVNGDGADEFVIGSGPRTPPRVRVYDGNARLLSEFLLDAAPSSQGVKPVVTDIDGDGKADILVPGQPF
jgi:hypothetical protein